MEKEVIKELQKLYPKVRIPIEEECQYYIDTLLKQDSYCWLNVVLKNLNNLKESTESITKYKFKAFDKLVEWFNVTVDNELSFTQTLNAQVLPSFEYTKKSFADWNDRKIYISIDLCEANWSVYKKYSGLGQYFKERNLGFENKNWTFFMREFLKFHPAIADSKSFRQFVLGNTNPKKLSRLQEYEMFLLNKTLTSVLDDNMIVGKNSDEIIIELEKDINNYSHLVIQVDKDSKNIDDIIHFVNNLTTDLPVKTTIFTMTNSINFGEFVRVKNILNNDLSNNSSELFGVIGSRFYMHFKTLILKEELDERDLLYMNDGFKCKWII